MHVSYYALQVYSAHWTCIIITSCAETVAYLRLKISGGDDHLHITWLINGTHNSSNIWIEKKLHCTFSSHKPCLRLNYIVNFSSLALPLLENLLVHAHFVHFTFWWISQALFLFLLLTKNEFNTPLDRSVWFMYVSSTGLL